MDQPLAMPASAESTEVARLARTGADSVFGYLVRTAEAAPEVPGGARWRTLSYQNRPGYDPGLWDGAAGIGLFLADYARLTGSAQAADRAAAALSWSTAAAPAELDADEGYAASLGWGWSGIGLAWLRLAAVTGRADHLAGAVAMGGRLLAAGPGRRLSLLQGAAGRGAFLLRLWVATRDERYLDGALRCAEALRGRLLPAACGGTWPPASAAREGPGAGLPLSLAGGLAGVGHFWVLLAAATTAAKWAAAAGDVAALLTAAARPDGAGCNWPPTLGGGPMRLPNPELVRCQWCIGGAGIGLFFAAAAEVLGDPSLLQTAAAAGRATFAHGDVRANPSYCHGLAGNAQLFLELYRITGDASWLARAGDFAVRALGYRNRGPDGDTWPADEPGLVAPNFSTGAAGVGHFFLRLLDPQSVPLALP